MATFNIDLPKQVDPTNPEEIKKLNSYLYQLNEQLQYMFNNIDPKENYSSNAYVQYLQDMDTVSKMEVSLKKIELSYVGKDNIINSINLSGEGITIKGSKISLEGVVTANNYFKINTDGSMECTNGTFSGKVDAATITGGTIQGATIGTESDNFSFSSQECMLRNWSFDSSDYFNTPTSGYYWESDGTIHVKNMYIGGESLASYIDGRISGSSSSSSSGSDSGSGSELPNGPVT